MGVGSTFGRSCMCLDLCFMAFHGSWFWDARSAIYAIHDIGGFAVYFVIFFYLVLVLLLMWVLVLCVFLASLFFRSESRMSLPLLHPC